MGKIIPRRADGSPLDVELIDMLVYSRGQVQDYFGEDLWEADIDWDRGTVKGSGTIDVAQAAHNRFKDSEVSHAIGFICGVACGLDMTPLELLDYLPARPRGRDPGSSVVLSIPMSDVREVKPTRPDPAYLPACRREGKEPCSVHEKKWNDYNDRCGKPATPKKPRKTKARK